MFANLLFGRDKLTSALGYLLSFAYTTVSELGAPKLTLKDAVIALALALLGRVIERNKVGSGDNRAKGVILAD